MSRLRWQVRSFASTVAMIMVAATGMVLLSGPAGLATSAEQNCWTALTAPANPGQQIELKDVSALPNGEVWAVGNQNSGGVNFGGLVLRFDGSAWTQVRGPFGTGRLEAVEAIAPDNIWVVGSTVTDQKIYTLIVHWDGTRWSVVPSPNPGADGNGLAAISALSPNDIWAAGSTVPSRSSAQPLFLHWDGQTWTERPSPNIGGISTISGIAAVSSNDVWAVGSSGSYGAALAMHWDGTRWEADERVLGLYPAKLSDVVALSANDIWAVGTTYWAKGSSTLAIHWDGTRWTRVTTPLYGSQMPVFPYSSLRGIAAVGPNDIWAVGSWGDRNTEFQPDQPFVLRWNGSYWGIAHENFSARNSWLEAVSAVANGKAVAVGSYVPRDVNEGRGLIMREGDAPCVIPSPTATQTYPTPLTPIVTETPGGPPTATRAVPLNPPVPVPGSGSRTFPETGKTMTGIFLDYWNTRGGLPQQGYPISNVLGEVSDLNGRLYTMQYTERAIFEYHPENAKPYDVLLSHLGRFQLRNRYPTGTPKQTSNDQAGSILFKETGKRLGGAFLKYWQQNGGLMQQGYPLTDEFTEVSELDRMPYTVQYFERAVFEYHPENMGTQYEVLLSQLGTYRWRDKYGQNPPVPPTVVPTSSPTTTPLARGVIGRAVANNRYLFWIDDNMPTFSIYGYDWEEKRVFLVTNRPGFKFSLAVDDKTLVHGRSSYTT